MLSELFRKKTKRKTLEKDDVVKGFTLEANREKSFSKKQNRMSFHMKLKYKLIINNSCHSFKLKLTDNYKNVF